MNAAIVLLSGGVDSTTALAQAIADGNEQITALSLRYGSTHQTKEMEAADRVVRWFKGMYGEYKVMHHILDLPDIFRGGGSALMGDAPMPMEEYKHWESNPSEGPSITVVPFRNANLLSAATTMALVGDYQQVYAGMHATDHGGWAYPDCSPEFLGAFANAMYVGTMHRVRLRFPFVWMTKADVVSRAYKLGAPLQHTWSCYTNGEVHCGQCPTCYERIKAFKVAGFADPVPYATKVPTGTKKWISPEPE